MMMMLLTSLSRHKELPNDTQVADEAYANADSWVKLHRFCRGSYGVCGHAGNNLQFTPRLADMTISLKCSFGDPLY